MKKIGFVGRWILRIALGMIEDSADCLAGLLMGTVDLPGLTERQERDLCRKIIFRLAAVIRESAGIGAR